MRAMRAALITIIILIATGALAQCPVEITDVYVQDEFARVYFVNTGTKSITGVAFALEHENAVGELEPYDRESSYRITKGMPPGKKDYTVTQLAFYTPFERAARNFSGAKIRTGIHAWLRKAKFTDGTIWEDTGSHSCRK